MVGLIVLSVLGLFLFYKLELKEKLDKSNKLLKKYKYPVPKNKIKKFYYYVFLIFKKGEEIRKQRIEDEKKEKEAQLRIELIGKKKSEKYKIARQEKLKKLKESMKLKKKKYLKIYEKSIEKANQYEDEQITPLENKIEKIECEILHEKAIDNPSINLINYSWGGYDIHQYRLKRFGKSKMLGYYDRMVDGYFVENSKRFERTGERGGTYELKVSKNGNFYRHYY